MTPAPQDAALLCLKEISMCWDFQPLAVNDNGFWDDPSYLRCGAANLQFSLPSNIKDSAFVLRALDHKGKTRDLRNSSACGIWVGQKPDGSLLVGAAYDGCFVREKNGDHVMTISLEEVINGQAQQHKRDLKCPIMPAMDAPKPNICAAVMREDRLPCATPPISSGLCDSLGCCFNPMDATMPCYYGNPLTAQCAPDNYVQVAVSKEVTMPSLILDSVNVVNVNPTSCPELRVSKSNSFIAFRFPLSCGASKQINENSVVYENTIEAKRDIRMWQGASITRDSTMRVSVRCLYSRSGIVPLRVEVFTLPPPLPISTVGPLLLEMRIARDPEYSSYYTGGDYPVQKVLRDPVYLEVRILQRTDPNLVLILNECWANPSADPTQLPQWPILVDRCPFPGDNYLTLLKPIIALSLSFPFPSHYQRFMISTFAFVDGSTQNALKGLVYFHCSASVCVPSTLDSCSTTCARRKKRMIKKVNPGESDMVISSDGPVEFASVLDATVEMEGNMSPNHSAFSWPRGTIAAGVFVIGVFIVAFWMHHKKRAPKMYTVKA
ncbi:zona pellucida sperm-binding protein 4-like [Spea bombifrons]|uniref:zona pellucida sperm-binding protein 4-like n=1 Tax=Spea bombifrons TaxID=233779 RepID=UPI00234A1B58|nr:zona pellucida sperm-binding protein 4-like [Spea bombifrons]